MVMISWTKLILYGIIVGISNIIPGVSGGTTAVILNIYAPLISAVAGLKTNFKRSMRFLLPFLCGGGLGILLFSSLINYSLENYYMQTNFFFMGLILGSIPMLCKRSFNEKLRTSSGVLFFIAFGVMLCMILIKPEESAAIMTDVSLSVILKLFFVSIIAATAMIIPGISGSFVMLLFGTYTTVLSAISSFNIVLLLPVGLGVLLGIFGGAKLIERLFKCFPSQTYFSITGLVVGSVFVIFPGFSFDSSGVVSIFCLLFGFVMTYWFSLEKRERITLHKKGEDPS